MATQEANYEEMLLGWILTHPEDAHQVNINENYVYIPEHKVILKIMLKLRDMGKEINYITIEDYLSKENESVDMANVMNYPNSLSYFTISLPSLLEKIHSNHLLTQLKLIAIDVHNKADSKMYSGADILDEISTKINNLQKNLITSNIVTIKKALKEVLSNIAISMKSNKKIGGHSTGFAMLDNLTSGFREGQLIILAGRPAMGKTTLALNMVRSIGSKSIPVCLFSCEMEYTELTANILSAQSRVDSMDLRSNNINDDDYERINNANKTLSDYPIFIDSSPGIDYNSILNTTKKLIATKNIKMVFIDYLQLIKIPPSIRSSLVREQQVAWLSSSLKQLARECKIPIVLLCQLNRGIEYRQTSAKISKPKLSDLRESGSLEQDADVVLFIHRDNYYNHNSDENTAEIIISKQRNGPTGTIDVNYIPEYCLYEDNGYDFANNNTEDNYEQPVEDRKEKQKGKKTKQEIEQELNQTFFNPDEI